MVVDSANGARGAPGSEPRHLPATATGPPPPCRQQGRSRRSGRGVMPDAVSATIGLAIPDPVFRRRPGGGNRAAHPPYSLGGVRGPRESGGSRRSRSRVLWRVKGRGERVSPARNTGRPTWPVSHHTFMRSHINRTCPAYEKWLRFRQNRGFASIFDWRSSSVLWYNSGYRRPVRRVEKVARSGLYPPRAEIRPSFEENRTHGQTSI